MIQQGEEGLRLPLPPRPNLGPEPWPETQWPSAWWLGLGAFPLLLAGWRYRRTRKPSGAQKLDEQPSGTDRELSATERFLALVARLRETLVARFGMNWVAMTTEELDVALQSKNIGTRPARIVELFRVSDRVKFADHTVDSAYLIEAESLASTFFKELADGASSNQNGR